MEVKLDKRYPIPTRLEQAWDVLSDIHATAACMPGAQITEQLDATHFKGTVKSRVGPATMVFQGDIEVQGLDAARHELKMLAKGADKGGSSAAMKLHAHLEPGEVVGECVLVGTATVTVSGKLAQFGSRLLVPVSDAMLAQFADNFRAAAAAVAAAPAGEAQATVAVASEGAGAATSAQPATSGEVLPAQGSTEGDAAAIPVMAPSMPKDSPAAATTQRPLAPVKELNALALMWTVIRGWFAGLFGKRT